MVPTTEVKAEDAIKPEGNICVSRKWSGSRSGFVKKHMDGEKHSFRLDYSHDQRHLRPVTSYQYCCVTARPSDSKIHQLICKIKGLDGRETPRESDEFTERKYDQTWNWLNSPEQPSFYC